MKYTSLKGSLGPVVGSIVSGGHGSAGACSSAVVVVVVVTAAAIGVVSTG